MTEATIDLGLEEAKESITAKGRERGFVTSEDLLESLPVEDLTPEQVEDFLSQVEQHLRDEGIEVIEVPGEELAEEAQRLAAREDDVLKAPTNDPVRMYLKEIRQGALLTAAQEEADRGQPPAGGLDRQTLRRPGNALPRPDPGGEPRADPGRREVRLLEGLQVLDVRHVVDPPGHHPRHRRPGPHHPHPRAHGG